MNSARQQLAFVTAILLSTSVVPAFAQASSPAPIAGYQVKVFATGTDKYTKPDSIVYAHGHIFVAYGGPGLPDGSDGKSSYLLEYTRSGDQVHVYTVLGHSDGLKLNPYDGKLYAMQNEDANPSLVIIDPETKQQTAYKFAALPPHGGGYDDMVFRDHKLYLSCSNPANNPNTKPAIVRAKFVNGLIEVTPVLEGDASATTVPTGVKAPLNLQDPDSMTTDPEGDLCSR